MRTLIGIARVYKIFFIIKLRLPGEDQEQYMAYIIAWQAKRGYLRFRGSKTKEKTLKEKQ